MFPIRFLNLPDSFVVGVILTALLLLAILTQYRRRKQGYQRTEWLPIVIPAMAAIVCLAYASTVVVPSGKLALVGNENEPRPHGHGLQFKWPWESTKAYDDVIVTAPLNYGDPENIPMSREISTQRDFTWSYAADRKVDKSYLLGNACIRTFNELIKAGLSTSYEFTCTFDDKSILVLRD